MIQIVLRRPGRMIRMRMIETEQLAAELGGLLLGDSIVRRTHHESAPRPLFRRVRQGDCRGDAVATADEGAATLVRIGLLAVAPNLAVDLRIDDQRLHVGGLRHQSSFQNFSVRYFSAPSGHTVTMIPVFSFRATWRTAATAAPEEMPAMTPSSRASRLTMSNASSLSTRRSSSAMLES